MAVSAKWYGLALRNQFGGTAGSNTAVDWISDTINVSLHSVSYVPAQDTDDFFDDATNELTTTGGYTAGGVTLASKTCTYDTTSNEARLDAGDVSWTSASFTARIAVVYDATPGTAATNQLISYVDFGGDETVSAGTFTIQWDSTGVAKITAS